MATLWAVSWRLGLKTTETLLGIETLKDKTAHKTNLGLKTTETLLGIETGNIDPLDVQLRWKSQNYWNPFRDWNGKLPFWFFIQLRLKTTETLLGIETYGLSTTLCFFSQSQNYWNPFRDWNGSARDTPKKH